MIGLATAALAAMNLQSSPVPVAAQEFLYRQVRLTDGDQKPHLQVPRVPDEAVAPYGGATAAGDRIEGVFQPRPRLRLYRWSVAALLAGAALDTASSWGRYELNPVLGRGEFGSRQVGIKIGLTAGALVAQRFLLRRFNRPKSRRALAVLNLLQAGALGVVAGRNWTR